MPRTFTVIDLCSGLVLLALIVATVINAVRFVPEAEAYAPVLVCFAVSYVFYDFSAEDTLFNRSTDLNFKSFLFSL
mgnify:CR=1 FL=1